MLGVDEYVLLLTESGAGGHVRGLAEARNTAWKLTLHGWTVRCRRISWTSSEYRLPVWQVTVLEVHGFPDGKLLNTTLAAVGRRHSVEYRLTKTSFSPFADPTVRQSPKV
jgi:hypothetical protein